MSATRPAMIMYRQPLTAQARTAVAHMPAVHAIKDKKAAIALFWGGRNSRAAGILMANILNQMPLGGIMWYLKLITNIFSFFLRF